MNTHLRDVSSDKLLWLAIRNPDLRPLIHAELDRRTAPAKPGAQRRTRPMLRLVPA